MVVLNWFMDAFIISLHSPYPNKIIEIHVQLKTFLHTDLNKKTFQVNHYIGKSLNVKLLEVTITKKKQV